MPRRRPASRRAGLAVALLLAVVVLGAPAAASTFCGSFAFLDYSDELRTRLAQRSLARVHAAGATDTGRHLGAATVVSLDPFLLVTAAHVVPDDAAAVSFPGLYPERPYPATVVRRATASGADGRPLDFAVLAVAEPPPVGVDMLEVWLDELDSETPHSLYSFGRDSPAALVGHGGVPARQRACDWRMRGVVFNGDSGGAVVSKGGLLVGVILAGREGGAFSGGAMGQVALLPLHCVRADLLAAFAAAAPAPLALLAGDRQTLRSRLQPPRPSSGWIDNLSLAHLLAAAVDEPSSLEPLRRLGTGACPWQKAVLERKLGLEEAFQLATALAESPVDAAALLSETAEELAAEGDAALALRSFAAVDRQLARYIDTAGPTAVGRELVQAHVVRASALSRLGELTGDDGLRETSIAVAAQGALLAEPGPERGYVLSSLGELAFRAGDLATATAAANDAVAYGHDVEANRALVAEICREPGLECAEPQTIGRATMIDDQTLRALATTVPPERPVLWQDLPEGGAVLQREEPAGRLTVTPALRQQLERDRLAVDRLSPAVPSPAQ